ncbi:MAG: hypothetical protein ABH834_02470 [Candidatus Altiarchaeota archaeon]
MKLARGFALLALIILLSGCLSQTQSTTTLPIAEKLMRDAYGKVGVPCRLDDDCEVPAKYAVLSHCPYGSACIEGKCAVVCPMWVHHPDERKSVPVECALDSDCDCMQFSTVGTLECICHMRNCLAVVAREPHDTDFEEK